MSISCSKCYVLDGIEDKGPGDNLSKEVNKLRQQIQEKEWHISQLEIKIEKKDWV